MDTAAVTRETITFLQGLEANNSRNWFEAHRAEYERHWLGAGLDLIAALSAPCAEVGLLAVPKLNASLRRIHRDVRFSRDKRPYEPRLHVILSAGLAFNRAPGVHLVIGPRGIGYGAGTYGLEPAALERFRRLVCEPAGRAGFEAVLARAEEVGAVLDPPDLARVPKGFEAAPWDSYLRRKSVIVRTPQERPIAGAMVGPGATDEWMAVVGALAPLAHWLTRL